MVERFNQSLKKAVLTKYHFNSVIEMNGKMVDFINEYNMTKRIKKLNYKTPFSISKRRKGKDTTMYRYLIVKG